MWGTMVGWRSIDNKDNNRLSDDFAEPDIRAIFAAFEQNTRKIDDETKVFSVRGGHDVAIVSFNRRKTYGSP